MGASVTCPVLPSHGEQPLILQPLILQPSACEPAVNICPDRACEPYPGTELQAIHHYNTIMGGLDVLLCMPAPYRLWTSRRANVS